MKYIKYDELTFNQKRAIYDDYINDYYTKKEICEMFCISEYTFYKVIRYMEGEQV